MQHNGNVIGYDMQHNGNVIGYDMQHNGNVIFMIQSNLLTM